jgi:molecular chaperone GrpE
MAKTKKNTHPSVDTSRHQEQIAALKDQLARSMADYINLEKRIETQRQSIAAVAAFSIVDKIVSALDDLYLAQSHLNDQGLQMAIDKLINLLKSEGLSEVVTEDVEFDPSLMDCVQAIPGPENKVISVHKKGYLFKNELVRPAQVIVGNGQVESSK